MDHAPALRTTSPTSQPCGPQTGRSGCSSIIPLKSILVRQRRRRSRAFSNEATRLLILIDPPHERTVAPMEGWKRPAPEAGSSPSTQSNRNARAPSSKFWFPHAAESSVRPLPSHGLRRMSVRTWATRVQWLRTSSTASLLPVLVGTPWRLRSGRHGAPESRAGRRRRGRFARCRPGRARRAPTVVRPLRRGLDRARRASGIALQVWRPAAHGSRPQVRWLRVHLRQPVAGPRDVACRRPADAGGGDVQPHHPSPSALPSAGAPREKRARRQPSGRLTVAAACDAGDPRVDLRTAGPVRCPTPTVWRVSCVGRHALMVRISHSPGRTS